MIFQINKNRDQKTMSQTQLTETFSVTTNEASEDLRTLIESLNSDSLSMVKKLANSVGSLTDATEQFAAEKILAFYLDPNAAADNDDQHLVFKAWTELITKLDKTHYPQSTALITGMGAKFEYADWDAPLHQAFTDFRRKIAEPHNTARQLHMATLGG
jgi:hypothetical protein